MVIPASSTEYMHVQVSVTPPIDLDGTPPKFAFLPQSIRTNPTPGDWVEGEWEEGVARVLIGPDGDIELTQGVWQVWIDIDPPNDEHVIRTAGTLVVT